jgi:hypothetical protein
MRAGFGAMFWANTHSAFNDDATGILARAKMTENGNWLK